MKIPFIGPAYTERSPDLNAQTCVNLYPVTGGPNGRSVRGLYGTPGYRLFANMGAVPVRGMHVYGGDLFAVVGADLFRVDSLGAQVKVGALASVTGRVSMADNGRAMMIVDGSAGYLWDGAKLAQITDPSFPGAGGGPAPSQVVFSGGYFLFDKSDGNPGEFMLSKLYAVNPSGAGVDDFDATDFATAEADPDGLVAMAALSGNVWMLGASTTEIWYNSGAEVPFDPIGGARSDRGCAARWSVAMAGEALLWLSNDRRGRLQVVMGKDLQVVPVSTPALEFELEGYANVADATAYAYHQEGHTFYVLNLPSADTTWAFDLSTGMWHRRAGWVAPHWTRNRGDTYVYFAGKHLVGDHRTGEVFEIDMDACTDNGETIRRERTAPVIHAEGRNVFARSLELHAQMGVGRGNAAAFLLDWSDDGGHTWSPKLNGALGAAGEFFTRARWFGLGATRRRNFRFTITEPVPVALIDAVLDAEVGR